MGPLEFFDQLRVLVRQQREVHGPASAGAQRLILNRHAVKLLSDAIADSGPGGGQTPYAVMLGQPGQVGFVEGCRVFYDPALDADAEPVAQLVVESDEA